MDESEEEGSSAAESGSAAEGSSADSEAMAALGLGSGSKKKAKRPPPPAGGKPERDWDSDDEQAAAATAVTSLALANPDAELTAAEINRRQQLLDAFDPDLQYEVEADYSVTQLGFNLNFAKFPFTVTTTTTNGWAANAGISRYVSRSVYRGDHLISFPQFAKSLVVSMAWDSWGGWVYRR